MLLYMQYIYNYIHTIICYYIKNVLYNKIHMKKSEYLYNSFL